MAQRAIQCAVVTGGAGFIGSHLVDRLVAAGVPRIHVIDRLASTYGRALKERNLAPALHSGQVHLIDADVMDPALAERLPEGTIDVLVHLAAVNGPAGTCDDPIGAHRTNVSGTVRILELTRHRGIGHVVVAGRAAEADELRTGTASADLAREPADHWAAMATAAERFERVHAALHRVRITILHMPQAFGPRERPDGAVRSWLADGNVPTTANAFVPVSAMADRLCAIALSEGAGCTAHVPAWEHAVPVEALHAAIRALPRSTDEGIAGWQADLRALWNEMR